MSRCNCETPKTRADGNRRKCLLCGKLIPLKPKNQIIRWCNCEEPNTKSVESRKCLLCGKLLRLKRKDPEIPNWKITKDTSFNNCLRINFGKRTMIYNPNLYWVRYAGTKKAPVIYAYATPVKPTSILKEGDTVLIYEDPLTQQKVEGKAKLIKLLRTSDDFDHGVIMSRWLVQFENAKDRQYKRWIKETTKEMTDQCVRRCSGRLKENEA